MNSQTKTELVLGTAQLGTGYGVNNSTIQTEEQCIELLECAWDNGIRTLDTAEGYGPSESMIGAYHKARPENVFSVCTKLSGEVDPKNLKKHLCDSIERLNVKQIDVYYMHSFSTCKDNASIDAFKDAKMKGLLDRIGISIYEPEELSYILDNLSETISVVQIPFSIFDCARWINSDLLKRAKDAGLIIYVRSVYLQGLLFREMHDQIIEIFGLESIMSKIEELAQLFNVPKAQVAIDFVKETPEISALILGSETTEQIESNAKMIVNNENYWPSNARAKLIAESAMLDEDTIDPRRWDL